MPLVREDRGEQTAGVPVVPPGAPLGSYVWMRETLKASKCETYLKMRFPILNDVRPLRDDEVDRLEVEVL